METQEASEIWKTREAFLIVSKLEVTLFPPKKPGAIQHFFAEAQDIEIEVLFLAASCQ